MISRISSWVDLKFAKQRVHPLQFRGAIFWTEWIFFIQNGNTGQPQYYFVLWWFQLCNPLCFCRIDAHSSPFLDVEFLYEMVGYYTVSIYIYVWNGWLLYISLRTPFSSIPINWLALDLHFLHHSLGFSSTRLQYSIVCRLVIIMNELGIPSE
jgi:hypothetical protein